MTDSLTATLIPSVPAIEERIAQMEAELRRLKRLLKIAREAAGEGESK